MPVTAVLAGWFFLGESMTIWQYLLVLVIVAGVIVGQERRG